MIITQPRPLNFETPLGSGTVIQIAAPSSVHGQQAARAIRDIILEKGSHVEWHNDPEGSLLRTANHPVVIVGNLADNQCIKELYYHSLCATDLCYPGPGGYELRTLADPLGTAHNTILAGYSDEMGAAKIAHVFQEKTAETIPHLRELNITRLPIAETDVAESRAYHLPEIPSVVANTVESDNVGYLYFLTGEPALGDTYRRAWQAIVSCGFDRNENIVQSHLFSLSRFLPWRLVEHTGLFSDEERLEITQYIYGWAQSKEGWRHVANCERTQGPHNPRQNHELIPAMTLLQVANYFEAHFPDMPGPDQWRKIGRMAFEPYGSSWKPLCDGLCHGISMSLPVMIEYGIIDPEHRFFVEGGARQAAEYAMAVINNDGWIPAAGDSGVTRQFPGPILRIAADFLKDGRYKFVHDQAPQDRRFGWQPMMPRAFDSGVKPQIPVDHIGVTVIPMDPLVYHIWDKEPELAMDAVTTPPAAPIEQCFDKIAVRTGWELADDYLLIDGLGGGSHSYDDAGGIIEYARLGVSIIVQEDSLMHSAPEHHSLVTIVRDGETGIIPGFIILEEQRTDRNGATYLRIKSKDYAGADWVREVHLFPGKCAAIVDTITANTAGDYAIEAHFRTPTRVGLVANGAHGKRNSPMGGEVEIRLTSLLDISHLSVSEVPLYLRYPSAKEQSLWRERYHTDEVVLMTFTARKNTFLQPGESVRMVHLAQAQAVNETAIDLVQRESGLFIFDGKTQTELKSFTIKPPAQSLSGKGKSECRENLDPVFTTGSKITAIESLGRDSLAIGASAGTLTYLHQGQTKWSTDLKGPIHDIGVAQGESPMIVAGHSHADLSAFSATGEHLWASSITREPSPWPWWELPTPAPIQVAGGVSEGEAFFAVGCGDLQLRGFDGVGKERWMWRYNEGVPGRVTVTDVDSSGQSHIVVGGEILSDQATCRILKPEGTQVAELEVEGWTSMLTALAFGHDSERHFIGCGANRGDNLHLYELCEDQWIRRWLKRLGGQVTGIVISAETNRMLVATSQGFLLCYDLDGAVQWHLLFDNALIHLATHGEEVIAVDDKGELCVINLAGQIGKQYSLPGSCSLVSSTNKKMYFACGNSIYSI